MKKVKRYRPKRAITMFGALLRRLPNRSALRNHIDDQGIRQFQVIQVIGEKKDEMTGKMVPLSIYGPPNADKLMAIGAFLEMTKVA